MISPDQYRDVFAEAAEVVSFFRRSIATTDDKNLQTREQFAITGRAVSYSPAPKLIFTAKTNRAGLCTGRNNHAASPVLLAALANQQLDLISQLVFLNLVMCNRNAKVGHLFLHLIHQLGTIDLFNGRIVVNYRSRCNLAANGIPF